MNIRRKLLLTIYLLCTCSFASQAADLIVVANIDDVSITIKKRQVRDIFMGNKSPLVLKPVALLPNSEARFLFNTKIVGLTESRIQSYWAQMRFSGRKKPPQEFETIESLLTYVINNKDTVAYLPADTDLPEGLTVIYHTK